MITILIITLYHSITAAHPLPFSSLAASMFPRMPLEGDPAAADWRASAIASRM